MTWYVYILSLIFDSCSKGDEKRKRRGQEVRRKWKETRTHFLRLSVTQAVVYWAKRKEGKNQLLRQNDDALELPSLSFSLSLSLLKGKKVKKGTDLVSAFRFVPNDRIELPLSISYDTEEEKEEKDTYLYVCICIFSQGQSESWKCVSEFTFCSLVPVFKRVSVATNTREQVFGTCFVYDSRVVFTYQVPHLMHEIYTERREREREGNDNIHWLSHNMVYSLQGYIYSSLQITYFQIQILYL